MKVRRAKDGQWIADCRIKGKGPQYAFRFQGEADKALFNYKVDLARRGVGVEGKTMTHAAQRYFQRCKNNGLSDGTIGYYTRLIDRHVLPHVPIDVREVDVKVLQSFRTEPPHTIGPANNSLVFGLLCKLLDVAHEAEWIGINPLDELPDIKRRESYNRKARNEELHMPCRVEWWLCLNQSTGLLHLMFRLASTAGMRIGEIMGLRWEDVLLDRRCIRIVTTTNTRGTRRKDGERTKTRTSERLVPIDATLMGLLVTLKQAVKPRGSDRVCRTAGGEDLSMALAAHMLHQFLKDNGITRTRRSGRIVGAFGWHSFRHVFVARWITRQVPVATLMRWIGHKRPSTTIRTYGVLLRDRAAWEATDAVVTPPDLAKKRRRPS